MKKKILKLNQDKYQAFPMKDIKHSCSECDLYVPSSGIGKICLAPAKMDCAGMVYKIVNYRDI